ncbi:MAG: helix-turn-helix domain-containing protein, partial [Pseudomonadota bacterium]
MSGPEVFLKLVFLTFSGWVNRHQQNVIDYLLEERRVLKEQLGKQRIHLTDDQRRRLAVKAKVLGRKILEKIASITTPDTILAWYRRLVAKKYDGTAKRGKGRPRTDEKIVALVVELAKANPSWGYSRIQGALESLGYKVGRNTIKRILKDHGIEPAPERRKRMPWRDFINAHLDAIVAADFFNVEVLTLVGIVRFYVFFCVDLATRRVEIAGITAKPDGRWMLQVARNLTDAEEGFLRGKRFLILDRDPLYTDELRQMLKASGTEVLRLPPSSPNLNAFAERFVLSIKSECLSRLILLG